MAKQMDHDGICGCAGSSVADTPTDSLYPAMDIVARILRDTVRNGRDKAEVLAFLSIVQDLAASLKTDIKA